MAHPAATHFRALSRSGALHGELTLLNAFTEWFIEAAAGFPVVAPSRGVIKTIFTPASRAFVDGDGEGKNDKEQTRNLYELSLRMGWIGCGFFQLL